MHFTTSCFVVKVSCACHFLAQHTWLFQELKTSDNEIRLITTLVIIKIFNIKKSTKPSNEQKKSPSQNKTTEGLFYHVKESICKTDVHIISKLFPHLIGF